MRTIKIFTQPGCARCPQAKQAAATLKNEGFSVAEYDIATAEGLAEAAFYSIQATPSLLIEDEQEALIGDFRGEVPPVGTLRDLLSTT